MLLVSLTGSSPLELPVYVSHIELTLVLTIDAVSSCIK